MSRIINLIFIFFLFISCHAHRQSDDQSFVSIRISQNGLDFLKDLLMTKAIASLTPLQLPQLEKTLKIPFVGNVRMVLSNLTIYHASTQSSLVKSGDTGITIVALGDTCNLSMNWNYSYSTWLVPYSILDKGNASVQVEGMELGLILGFENQDGALKLSLLESESYVKDISIKLDGGASWLYQGLVDAFKGKIGTAVEKAITKKLREGVSKLDSFVHSLPRVISMDDIASMNVTLVTDPVLSNSSIGFELSGLFINAKQYGSIYSYPRNSQLSVSCTNPTKMLGISLDDAVFNSAASLYFNAEFVQWIVDKVPDQSLLNTAGWRFIVPQLYKKYPNDDMNLNISLSSPPVIGISLHGINAIVYADLIINVLKASDLIPVACISLAIKASGTAKIFRNNLAGNVKLDDFSMSLKWSTVGNLRMYLIQPVVWTAIETVFLPYVNSRLGKGLPLPIMHGFKLQNAEIIYLGSRITVCSDVALQELYNIGRPQIY